MVDSRFMLEPPIDRLRITTDLRHRRRNLNWYTCHSTKCQKVSIICSKNRKFQICAKPLLKNHCVMHNKSLCCFIVWFILSRQLFQKKNTYTVTIYGGNLDIFIICLFSSPGSTKSSHKVMSSSLVSLIDVINYNKEKKRWRTKRSINHLTCKWDLLVSTNSISVNCLLPLLEYIWSINTLY